jgi:hypothetical protein
MSAFWELVLSVICELAVLWPWGGEPRPKEDWPSAASRVIRATVRPIETMYGREYIADVTYEFEVKGRRFGGQYERAFKADSAARGFLQRVGGRGTIVVRYRPHRPKFSFVMEADNPELFAG